MIPTVVDHWTSRGLRKLLILVVLIVAAVFALALLAFAGTVSERVLCIVGFDNGRMPSGQTCDELEENPPFVISPELVGES